MQELPELFNPHLLIVYKRIGNITNITIAKAMIIDQIRIITIGPVGEVGKAMAVTAGDMVEEGMVVMVVAGMVVMEEVEIEAMEEEVGIEATEAEVEMVDMEEIGMAMVMEEEKDHTTMTLGPTCRKSNGVMRSWWSSARTSTKSIVRFQPCPRRR